MGKQAYERVFEFDLLNLRAKGYQSHNGVLHVS